MILLLALYLGLHDGYLAIINSTGDAPVKVFPYCASLFPKADQEALAQGIPLENELDYHKRMEDFLS